KRQALCHSTSAYLGLVFIAVGLGHVDIAFLLVFSHAIAKALLFMSAGAAIMTTSDQNITEMGGLWSRMPATTTAFVVGSAGMVALLPMGMFWTWAKWFDGSWKVSLWLLAVLVFVNGLCAFNLTRIFRSVFLGTPQKKTRRAPEVAWPMALPMVTLTIFTLIAPLAPIRWQLWLSEIEPIVNNNSFAVQVAIPLLILSGLLGCLIGVFRPIRRAWERLANLYLRFFQDLFAYDFYLDKVYEVTVVALVANISKLTAWFDRYVVDGVVNLISLFTIFSGNALKYNVSGQSQFYVLTMLISIALFLWFILSGQWSLITDFWSKLLGL
ncbi:MAG: proton-conducting transporter membrane subunit, partial [Crocosphaera sp.]